MKYDAMYFLKKFDAIPEENWTTNVYADEMGRCCAYGHCGSRDISDSDSFLADQLETLFRTSLDADAAAVNDADTKYQKHAVFRELGDHPKERILNALLLINAGVTYRDHLK